MENFRLHENDNPIEAQYLILNPAWEKELQDFDPNLRLILDKENQRWVIAEFIPGNQYPNIIFYLEDENKKPKPFGKWVFNKLFVKQQRWAAYQRRGGVDTDQYLKDLKYQSEKENEEKDTKNSEETAYQISHDINKWRKAFDAANNLPTSDVTAGFAKESK